VLTARDTSFSTSHSALLAVSKIFKHMASFSLAGKSNKDVNTCLDHDEQQFKQHHNDLLRKAATSKAATATALATATATTTTATTATATTTTTMHQKKIAVKLGIAVNTIVFVLPGLDSLQKGYDKAVAKGLNNIHLLPGTHIVSGNCVSFKQPMTVSGDGREKTFIKGGGFFIEGGKDMKNKRCIFMDMTVQTTKGDGVKGWYGMSFYCLRCHFDHCSMNGIYAESTHGRLTNCQVTRCTKSGIRSASKSTLSIDGKETMIANNVVGGSSYDYALEARFATSIIMVQLPLTKESVSVDNHGGGNYGGQGTIQSKLAKQQQPSITLPTNSTHVLRVGVVQMTATDDRECNFKVCKDLIEKAASLGMFYSFAFRSNTKYLLFLILTLYLTSIRLALFFCTFLQEYNSSLCQNVFISYRIKRRKVQRCI